MSPMLILLMLTAVIGLAGVCAAIVLSLRLQRLKQLMHQNNSADRADASVPSEPVADFQGPLQQATLKQRLRQHRPQGPAPDKYRTASGLAARGMSVQQIADLLALPPAEVRQLVSLSRVGRIDATPDTERDVFEDYGFQAFPG